jgi:thiol-disulfide isomerase/thioredoxin
VTRRHARTLLLALAVALLAAGCGFGGDDEVEGGASDLPGPVPEGVSFAPAPDNALAAPDFTAELVDGTPVRASDLWRDRPLVLVFTASWCERCAGFHREAVRIADEHPGVAVLAVVPEDDAEDARDYASELALDRPVASASERIWLNYAAREPPVVVLVSRGGKVLRGWPGGVEPGVLDGELDDLVASR